MSRIKRTKEGMPRAKDTEKKYHPHLEGAGSYEETVSREELLSWRRPLCDPEQGGIWKKYSCLPLLPQVPPTGLKQPRSRLAKDLSAQTLASWDGGQAEEGRKQIMGSRQRSRSPGPQQYCLTVQSWFLYVLLFKLALRCAPEVAAYSEGMPDTYSTALGVL